MAGLDDWFAARDTLRRLYQEELWRDLACDPDAITNWLYHFIANRQTEDWVRARIRESPEWREKHNPNTPPAPAPPTPPEPAPPAPNGVSSGGGFLEDVDQRTPRPRLTAAEMAAFLPERGRFRFPAPYGSLGIRLTNASDGRVHPVGMAYWPNINHHAGRPELRVLLSVDGRLVVYVVDKTTGQVTRGRQLPVSGTGEGLYWAWGDPYRFYVPAGGQLLLVNADTTEREVVVDAGGEVRQCHSSADGRVHSMTLDGQPAVAVDGAVRRFTASHYDECQVDKSGRWLLIKEGTANRLIDLATDATFVIHDTERAVGHSDMGYGYMVGEEDRSEPGGVFRLWMFTEAGPRDGGAVYSTDWTPMSRYVSHANARPAAPAGQVAVVSAWVNADVARGNELVVVPLNGARTVRVLCPNLTDLRVTGDWDSYWLRTRANVDAAGQYACWTANMGTDRVDAFLVRL